MQSDGTYQTPSSVPAQNTVTIKATSVADTTVTGTTTVTLLNPLPVIQSVTPSEVNINLAFTLDIKGTGFIASSKVMLGTTALTANFVSATELKASGTTSAAAGTVFALTVVNPDPGGSTSNTRNITVLAPVKVTVSPSTNVAARLGDTKQFAVSVQNAVDKTVKWAVNSAAAGTVDATGLYKAPATLPTPPAATITAASTTDPTATSSVTLSLLNPLPVLTSVSPPSVNFGPVTLTIIGSGFVPGATVMLGSTPLTISSLTPTQIMATGAAAPVPGNLATVTVANPNPGGTTSNALIVSESQSNPVVSYNAAYRFLEQATFGPNPADIQHLQQIGFNAWLNEQLNAPVSDYTDPPDTTTGFGPTQDQFFVNAINGKDQLRQRVAFALSQIWVISGQKVPKDVALIPYLRILSSDAFGSYRTLMKDITLNPAMGNYLDMVNNDKFNSKTGVAPNENYAREVMQLFTIGTVLLNTNGSNTTNPPTPTYDQNTVATMAQVFTGWTYPPTPGTITLHHNPPNYFGPMVAIESLHDTSAKPLFGTTLNAGQTADQDLEATLDILFNHQNVGPFVALRLIQHLVKSNPSPLYITNVAAAFNQSPRGNLWNVVKAVLLDPEARAGDSNPPAPADGHLREPVLLMTHLLKALGATVATGNPLTSQGSNMGQVLFDANSVFNYYSPFFRTAGGTLLGPEFQLMTPSTSLLRPNFTYAAATNGLGKNVTVDISPFLALAAQPDKLLDSLNTALMHGNMSANMRGSILTALNAVTDLKTRAQYAIFLVASSSQYQVEE
jgi:uncharacterized protein (DUF1800 family)